MSLKKITTLWDSMKAKLNDFQAQLMLDLTQIEYDFDFDTAYLLPISPSKVGDKIRHEMLKKVNSIEGVPFIAHVSWTKPPSVVFDDHNNTYELKKEPTILLYGLFDVYLTTISTPNDFKTYEHKLENFAKKIDPNVDFIDYYEAFQVLEYISDRFLIQDFVEYKNNLIKHLSNDLRAAIPAFESNWWMFPKTVVNNRNVYETFMREYQIKVSNFIYRDHFASLFFKKNKDRQSDRILFEDIIQSRTDMINNINYPILISPNNNQFNQIYASRKKNLLSLMNTYNEEQKYLYGEYGKLFRSKIFPIYDFSFVLDYVLDYLESDSAFQMIIFLSNGYYFITQTNSQKVAKKQIKEPDSPIYVQELKQFPNNYHIVPSKASNAILFDLNFIKSHYTNGEFYQLENTITFVLKDNYYFQILFWTQEFIKTLGNTHSEVFSFYILNNKVIGNWKDIKNNLKDGKNEFADLFYPELSKSSVLVAYSKLCELDSIIYDGDDE